MRRLPAALWCLTAACTNGTELATGEGAAALSATPKVAVGTIEYGPGRDQTEPGLAWNGSNHLAVWHDSHSERIVGLRTDAAGTALAPAFVIGGDDGLVGQPRVVANANGVYLVVWSDGRNSGPLDSDIYGARVDSGGT